MTKGNSNTTQKGDKRGKKCSPSQCKKALGHSSFLGFGHPRARDHKGTVRPLFRIHNPSSRAHNQSLVLNTSNVSFGSKEQWPTADKAPIMAEISPAAVSPWNRPELAHLA